MLEWRNIRTVISDSRRKFGKYKALNTKGKKKLKVWYDEIKSVVCQTQI
jgi:hypothetical protein